jgi:fatty acid kinase fatty acid binding subunit
MRIVIDSAGDMPAGWAHEFDIQVIPINIHFGEQTFLSGVDLSNKDFYRLADESGVIPKTSQPTPQQFIQFYEKIAQIGETIISLHVTGKLSGTLDSARIAARELVGKYNIIPLDSASGSAAMGYMAREARLMERGDEKVEQIVQRLEQISRKIQIILTLNTLEYARRSGRVKALQAALASLLNVKPVIILREGVLELGDRVRTRGKALEFVVDTIVTRLGRQLVNVAIVHAEDPQAAETLLRSAQAKLNCNDLIVTDLSIGVAANLGPGTAGIVAYPVEEIRNEKNGKL